MTSATPKPSRLSLIAAFAAVYVIWGSTYFAIMIAIETMPPFLMAGIRFLVAGVALYGFMRARGVVGGTWQQWKWAVLLGGLMMAGGNGTVTWAEQWVPSGLTSLIVATVPLWMTGLDATVFGGRRLTLPSIAGLTMGMIGVALLSSPSGSGAQLKGIVMLVIASLSWSIGSLLSRRAGHGSPLAMAGMQMIAGGVILTLWGTLNHEWAVFDWAAVSTRSWIALIYLITFGSIVALGAYVWLMRVTSAAAVSTYAFVNPIVAVALGWAFAGERLGAMEGGAAVLIIAAVATLQWNHLRQARSAEPATTDPAPTDPAPEADDPRALERAC